MQKVVNTRPLKESTNKQMLRPGGIDKPVKREASLASKTIKKDDAMQQEKSIKKAPVK